MRYNVYMTKKYNKVSYTKWAYKQGKKCGNCKCSLPNKNKSGYCRSCRMALLRPWIGRKHKKESIEKISSSRLGDKNPNWVGDNVQYDGLHQYVRKIFPKTSVCMECGKQQPIDLANKGTYNRSIENWEWLCRRCHMLKDGRMKNLKQNETSKSFQ